MSGTKEGGLKTAKRVKEQYGTDYYREIGRRGGKNGHTGGFYASKFCEDPNCGYGGNPNNDWYPEHKTNQCAGHKGGVVSRRPKNG